MKVIRMNRKYTSIINEIDEIHKKRRKLNIREDVLYGKIL